MGSDKPKSKGKKAFKPYERPRGGGAKAISDLIPQIGRPAFRRYGNDGYGEQTDTGGNYGIGGVMAPGQRGRIWPFFTGERGHYELAAVLNSPSADAIASEPRLPSRVA